MNLPPSTYEAFVLASVEATNNQKLMHEFTAMSIGYNLTLEQTFELIEELCNREANEWAQANLANAIAEHEETVGRGSFLSLSNFNLAKRTNAKGKTVTKKEPRSMTDVLRDIVGYTQGGIKQVDSVLFVDAPPHGLHLFDRNEVAGVFGFLRNHISKVQWTESGDFVSMSQVVSELHRTTFKYDAIEVLPHEPLIPNIYYACGAAKPGDGKHLKWLLKRFSPETTADYQLLKALLMTLAWGGPAGRRPLFAAISDDGRGVGKSITMTVALYLFGGAIDVSWGEDISQVKQRLLSGEAQAKRGLFVDNIKSFRLSWPEFESLITSPWISGKRMYVGEGQRPNYLTPIITLNGPNFGTDISQRAVIIKLVRPEYAPDWLETTLDYIDKHREEIIADIVAALRAEPKQLEQYTRWSDWERDILSRLENPEEVQQVILQRQSEANCELEEAEIVEAYFAERLTENGYSPDTDVVRIPNDVVAKWYCKATNERVGTTAVSRRLNQMSQEKQLKRLEKSKSHKHGRGFIWTGPNAALDAAIHTFELVMLGANNE